MKLTFGLGNAKLADNIATFSLPAGWTCPGAKLCLAKVVKGRIQDGKDQKFRCYAASQEVVYKNVYKSRQNNLKLLKSAKTIGGMKELIINSINSKVPCNVNTIRVHIGGDFFSFDYFTAWMKVAEAMPEIKFYAYTKSIHFWQKYGKIPDNFILTASHGGKFDNLIGNSKNAKVVFSPEEASKLKVSIDHDDSLALNPKIKSFSLLLHGTQLAKTPASIAWQKIKTTIGGYSRQNH